MFAFIVFTLHLYTYVYSERVSQAVCQMKMTRIDCGWWVTIWDINIIHMCRLIAMFIIEYATKELSTSWTYMKHFDSDEINMRDVHAVIHLLSFKVSTSTRQ